MCLTLLIFTYLTRKS
ncbi:hypothetical protein RNO50_23585, partial [Escherichia coli]